MSYLSQSHLRGDWSCVDSLRHTGKWSEDSKSYSPGEVLMARCRSGSQLISHILRWSGSMKCIFGQTHMLGLSTSKTLHSLSWGANTRDLDHQRLLQTSSGSIMIIYWPSRMNPNGPNTFLPFLKASQKKLSIFQMMKPTTKVRAPFLKVFTALVCLSTPESAAVATRSCRMNR